MASPEDKEMKKQWITVDGRQTPIILPQIWDHDKEEWIVTGTNNPLPTQVTGSNVEQLILLPATEIRDQDLIQSQRIDISKYKSYEIYVSSTLNKEVNLVFYTISYSAVKMKDGSFKAYNTHGGGNGVRHVIKEINTPSSQLKYASLPLHYYDLSSGEPEDKHFYKRLATNDHGTALIAIRLFGEAPTEGSIEVMLRGIK